MPLGRRIYYHTTANRHEGGKLAENKSVCRQNQSRLVQTQLRKRRTASRQNRAIKKNYLCNPFECTLVKMHTRMVLQRTRRWQQTDSSVDALCRLEHFRPCQHHAAL